MAESKDCHVIVEIPVDEEHRQKFSSAITTITAIQNHPLMEISKSPGHLLLLKLWQREEDLSGRRIAARETRMDTIRREIFQICCFFFIFHALFFTILFTSVSEDHNDGNVVCRKWWIPSVLSVCTSFCVVFLVQVKLYRFWKVSRQLQRERGDGRAVTRCISELRMKGASFDLSKEPLIGKKMKSSSVEIKWKPLTWLSQEYIEHTPHFPVQTMKLELSGLKRNPKNKTWQEQIGPLVRHHGMEQGNSGLARGKKAAQCIYEASAFTQGSGNSRR
ncbi:putative proteasome activator subunit 4-like isoform X1 [Capsicum annuum]|nr:putative proteasome activator subunit 4-like isoform X1 [Capsicum annuum]